MGGSTDNHHKHTSKQWQKENLNKNSESVVIGISTRHTKKNIKKNKHNTNRRKKNRQKNNERQIRPRQR